MEFQTLRAGNHAVFRMCYHIVLTVKFRHKAITLEMLQRLKDIASDVLEKWRCHLIVFGGEADHIHLLVEGHPAMDVSRMVGNLKTVTARRMRSEYADHLSQYFWKPYFWNKAYAVITVGGRASLETLLQYVQDQEQPPPAGALD